MFSLVFVLCELTSSGKLDESQRKRAGFLLYSTVKFVPNYLFINPRPPSNHVHQLLLIYNNLNALIPTNLY